MADAVRPLVVIAGAQALACAGLTVVVGLGALRSDLDVVIAGATVAMWLIITGVLALIWLGLYRRRRAARTPFLLAQAFALVVAWPLISSDVRVDSVSGFVLAAAAVLGVVLGLRPQARAALA